MLVNKSDIMKDKMWKKLNSSALDIICNIIIQLGVYNNQEVIKWYSSLMCWHLSQILASRFTCFFLFYYLQKIDGKNFKLKNMIMSSYLMINL